MSVIKGTPVGGGAAKSDWEQEDPGKSSFIRNKPPIAKGDGENSIVMASSDGFADGTASVVEGIGTIAIGDYQHVQGKYNKSDYSNQYAHIIGGGASDTDRKDIFTIDWQGNAEFAGDHIAVGGAKLTTEMISLLEGLVVAEGEEF